MRVPGHRLINQVVGQATPEELGGRVSHALADRLNITRADALRRVTEAAELGPRQAVTGEPLPPRLTATAAGERDGRLGAGHVWVIRRFFDQLPCGVDVETREKAEAHLAKLAMQHRPDELAKLADRLANCLNPDGTYIDEDRARRRRLTLGNQDADGMSPLRGWLTPEARATLQAVLAKLAAPGMCNPEDRTPVLDDPSDDEAQRRDNRSPAQRNHDGLNAALRAVLASGKLGQHNGLPASIVVTTTLKDLESGSGRALTDAGTLLPMSDVIRLARHAHHYLAIFDKGNASACITPNDWRRRASESSSTRRIAVAPIRVAMCPAIGARCTTSKAGPTRSAPTATSSPLPAGPITNWSTMAGAPENAKTVPPSGFRHPIWTAGSRG